MTSETEGRFGDRPSIAELVGLIAVAGLLYFAVGVDGTAVGALLGFVIGRPLVAELLAGFDVGPTASRVAFSGIVALAGGAVLVAAGSSVPVGVGVIAIGCWLLLDSLYEHRHGDLTRDEGADLSEEEAYATLGYSQWVVEALREADRLLSTAELRERAGLTRDELDEVLAMAQESGVVERAGNGYVVNESELGGIAAVRGAIRSVGSRLVRPLRLFRPSR